MFKFYILYSERADKFYVGHTGDNIFERLRKHNSDHNNYTRKYIRFSGSFQQQWMNLIRRFQNALIF